MRALHKPVIPVKGRVEKLSDIVILSEAKDLFALRNRD